MDIKVGTFNLNNLFSRFNFKAHVDELPQDQRDVTVTYEFTDEGDYRFRTFRGRLIQPMPEEQRQTLAARIKVMDLDVLAVQEVEDIEALNDFNRFHLGRLYPHVTLIEGNDARFIDVGVLSKLPLGGVTSWQHQVHAADPSQRVFARDLLQVDVLNPSRSNVCSRCSTTTSPASSWPSERTPWWPRRPRRHAGAGSATRSRALWRRNCVPTRHFWSSAT